MAQERTVPAYHELARIVVADQPLTATLTRVAEVVRDVVPGADDVSVTLVQGGKAKTVAFAGDSTLAAFLDERQYEAGYGPCLDACVSGGTIRIDDTEADDELYPDFTAQAARLGVRQTMSVGLPTIQEVTGAFNIYNLFRAGPFTEESNEVSAELAGYAAVAVANAALYNGAVEQVAHMQQAMASRAVIEQAKGIIMAGRGCGDEEAFEILRQASSRSNRKLRDIARSLVDGARRT
jgi:GAF domain-containing protein